MSAAVSGASGVGSLAAAGESASVFNAVDNAHGSGGSTARAAQSVWLI